MLDWPTFCKEPGSIFVGDFALTPGAYDLTVEFVDQAGVRIGTQSHPGYHVTDHGLNLIEVFSQE